MSSGMNTVEQVKQCHTPQEALLVLAAAIDALRTEPATDPWNQPLTWDEEEIVDAVPDRLVNNDNRSVVENGEVIVKPVSRTRQNARHDFACNNKLDEFFPLVPFDEFVAAYVKGGPRWLYYTNRDAVMQMPIGYREALVADVLLDSPSEADEIGRDILKFAFDEGARETAAVEALQREYGPAYQGRDVRT